MNKLIELKNISKSFDGEVILDGIDLTIYDNEFVTLLGPSGCGKTTTLRIIAGFETPDEGEVIFDGKIINDIPAYKRQVNTVFQRYALFPHLNVYENIAFGLRLDKSLSEEEISGRVKEMLKLVNMSGFEKRRVTTLSGGQQQRVAIARALIMKPRVLLLDEPLGALDLKLRKDMQNELRELRKTAGITFIYVTHDQEEALSMSDNVVVMDAGRIQQIGTPLEIYNEPSNAYVANFIGESNIVDGFMTADNKVMIAGKIFDCVDSGFEKDEPVDVVIRPEDIKITSPEDGMLKGIVTGITFLGVFYDIIVDIKGFKWMIRSIESVPSGSIVGISMIPDAFHCMKKSEYSELYGDYSSYSVEIDELSETGGRGAEAHE